MTSADFDTGKPGTGGMADNRTLIMKIAAQVKQAQPALELHHGGGHRILNRSSRCEVLGPDCTFLSTCDIAVCMQIACGIGG